MHERYARALEYFASCTDPFSLMRKAEVQRKLDFLLDDSSIAQIARLF